MTRRVSTPKSRKEQLQQQVLMMIRIIRRKLDDDILYAAHNIAVKMHKGQTKPSDTNSVSDRVVDKPAQDADNKAQYTHGTPRPSSSAKLIPFDKENARAAVASFLTLKKEDTNIAALILATLKKDER